MKIERKSLKAAIALFLAILISNLLKLKYPFFVGLPTIMPLTNSEAETIKAGRNRMIGTVIGALVGAVLVLIRPNNPLLGGIGIVVIIYLCSFIRWDSSASIAGLVFISILVGIKGQNPWIYSIDRIGDTFIGILISIFVNNVLFHTDFLRELNKNCIETTKIIGLFINENICSHNKFDIDNLYNHIQYVSKQLTIYQDEFAFKKGKLIEVEKYKSIINDLSSIFDHIKIIGSMHGIYTIYENNRKLLKDNGYCIPDNKTDESDEKNIIFNFHLNEILIRLDIIKSKIQADT